MLLADALRRAAGAHAVIGCRALMIHAIDDKACDFYRRCVPDIIEFPAASKSFFIPIETVLAAIG
jgi:hypothetical protein